MFRVLSASAMVRSGQPTTYLHQPLMLILIAGEAMRRITFLSILMLLSSLAVAQTADVTLTRLDCGTGAEDGRDVSRFSDTFAYPDQKVKFTYSCYLIKHNEHYLVWDAAQCHLADRQG